MLQPIFASPRAFGRLTRTLLTSLGLTALGYAATGTVTLQSKSPVTPKRKDSPPLASLPAPKAAGPLRILLVDDDYSSNNLPGGRDEPSVSDRVFRRLVTEAVGGDNSAWSLEVVPAHKHGPALERLLPFNLVIWYTGESYGGAHSNEALLSREDEKTVRAYLEQRGGAFVLLSPAFPANHSYGNSWISAPVPFFTELMGVNGFTGLAQRATPGTVTTPGGARFTVQGKAPPELQFSGVNPDGAAVVFTANLDPAKTKPGPVPVAVAHPYGGGRMVYVGFTFEQLSPSELTPAFRELLAATGLAASAPSPAVGPVPPIAVTPPRPATALPPALTPVPTTSTAVVPSTRPPVSRTIDPAVPSTIRPLDPAAAIKDVDFDNWGFEKGLAGWTASGAAFQNQPTYGDTVLAERVLTHMAYGSGGVGGDYWRKQGYPIGYKGRFWIGTYEKYTGAAGTTFGATQGDGPTGTLESPAFEITQSHCYFLIGGGTDANGLKVELQLRQADGSWKTELARTSFRNSELLHREHFALTAWKGKIARIRIVDQATGNWGHINVDDFLFRNDPLDGITLTDSTGRRYLVDADVPVWGIADTHAHPAHNNGFGGRTIVGKADDPLSATYSTQLCAANHSIFGAGNLNTIFIGGGDVHPEMSGWPDFIGFPRFNNKTHQQQHVDFMKRAWEGGVRLISALAVNNMYVPSLAMGPGHDGKPYDDDSVVLRQLQDLKNLAASQASWLEIAYTPKDARRIIAGGKCAMVLGVEVDNFGNFKVGSYNWNDAVGAANAKLVTLTNANADTLLTDKVNQYYNLGVRQVTPIHYLSGTFGGAAVFRGQIALIQFAFNNSIRVKDAIARKIPYSLRDDYDASMLAVLTTPADYLSKIEGPAVSTMNALGLTSYGRILTQKLMGKGMLLDSEHMGYDTKEEVFALAASRGYPVMSSHTDPSGLCHNWLAAPTFFQGSREDKMRNFGTTNIRNLASEFTMADEHYEKIRRSGGTVGVFMLPYLKKPYGGYLGTIANDCAGSTKTFAQMYLYSLDKMESQGVGIATDRGMVDFIAPRFGPMAGYTLLPETMLTLKRDVRRTQRLSQANGVKYDRPMGSFHASWYHQTDAESIDEHENDAWIAFAAFEANVHVDAVPPSAYVLHAWRIKNYVKGLRATSESQLEAPTIFNGDTPWQQAAMFCVRANRDPSALAAWSRYDANQQNRLRAIYIAIRPAWDTWSRKYGNNEPVRRYRTGNRDWDFNTDGMAHYGMMPDFLQDLRNIGLSPGQLTPMFRSADDYIKMWEKAVKASTASR